jgi:hypothetical protein
MSTYILVFSLGVLSGQPNVEDWGRTNILTFTEGAYHEDFLLYSLPYLSSASGPEMTLRGVPAN